MGSRKMSIEKAAKFLGAKPNPAPKKKNKPPVKKKYMTPEEMFIHFQAYRVKRKADPFIIEDFGATKNGIEKVKMNREKALTMDGFEIYLLEEGIISDIGHILANRDKLYTAYIPIISAIKKYIRDDQVTGGMGGIYNANLTSRLNGLSDKQEVKVSDSFDIEMDLS